MRALTLCPCLLLLAVPTYGADGVREINQACAVETGCFEGDAAGFPVSINSGGSYVLTSNLDVGGADATAIRVTVNQVHVDLGGHRIKGPAICFGNPATCVNGGSGVGIDGVDSGTQTQTNELVVTRGSIVGMGSVGIEGGARSRVADLVLRGNAGGGVDLGTGSHVTDSIAALNGGFIAALKLGDYSVVRGNTVINSGANGIDAGNGAIVAGNTSSENAGTGIIAGSGSIISGNSTRSNGGNGISVGVRTVISGNTSTENGGLGIEAANSTMVVDNNASQNDDDGILVAAGSTVQRNVLRANGQAPGGGYGIRTSSTGAYGGNVITFNATGAVFGAGVNLGNNFCAGTGVTSSTCP